MKVQFDHEFQSSLFLYLDNYFLYHGQGSGYSEPLNFQYYNETSDVGDLGDYRLGAFYCPNKQLVADGVPSGDQKVFISGGLATDGWHHQTTDQNDLLIIDHYGGRVILSTGHYGDPEINTEMYISGNFAQKDFNIYITNESEEQLFIENEFILADDNETYFQSVENLNSQRYVVPAVFISLNNTVNEPYGFGGEEDTREHPRLVCVADSNYGLDGILSLCRDMVQKSFPIIPFQDFPYGEYFHIKNTGYAYTGLKEEYQKSGHAYIENVITSKLFDRSSNKTPKNLRIGFVDLEVSNIRYPS